MIRTTSRPRQSTANNNNNDQQQLVVYNSHSRALPEEKDEWDFIRRANVRDTYKVLPIIIGTGSFGTVRSCIHRATRTKLAIKSLNVRTGHSGNAGLLKNEISLLQKLHHVHIVEVLDVLLDGGYVHIIMDHYTGKDLFDVIVGSSRPMNESAGRKIISQLLNAVLYLHERCIVHRDLKAEHIIFSGDDIKSPIKIIDFGVATIHKPGSAPLTAFAGSIRSIAPEIIRRRYGKECDMWSVGVITYFLITQDMPFNGATSDEIFTAIVSGKFYYPQWTATGLSEEAKDFINRLLVVDPRRRMSVKQALGHPWFMRRNNRYVSITSKALVTHRRRQLANY